jgi:hypothetical protein
MKYYSLYFGQAYGEGAYGENSYACTDEQQQNGTCTTAAGGSAGGNSAGGSSGLTDTGIAVAAIVTLACFVIFVSLIVRIWRRKPALQEVQVADDPIDGEQSPRGQGQN